MRFPRLFTLILQISSDGRLSTMRNYSNSAADARFEELLHSPEHIPFSFVYDGITHKGFGEAFSLQSEKDVCEGGKRTVERVYLLNGELTVRLLLAHYATHGATEFTVWLENNTEKPSGIIENMQTEMRFPGNAPCLKGILGDHENSYRPYDIDLEEENAHFVSDSGRATHVNFPYFNLVCGNGGALLAIGWAGTWTADFAYAHGNVTYRASTVNNLHARLLPGEKIRSALFVCIPYAGREEAAAVNLWRSWYIEWNLPKMDKQGSPLLPFSTCCLAGDTGLPNSDGSISERYFTWKPSLEKMMAEGIRIDFRWLDAGWYIAPDLTSAQSYVEGHDWWDTVGTWKLDPAKWPGDTLLESVEYGHRHGMKTFMWFEPERVTDPANLCKNFGYKPEWAIDMGSRVITNNIGNEDCLAYTIKTVTDTLSANKIDMYREDNNSDPAALWAYLDEKEGAERRGITECKFIINHYRLWDAIIAHTLSYGGCGFVDSCASGGGRNDLESMRRGIPLLRSDSDRTTTAIRLSMTHGFNKWLPFCGANTRENAHELAIKGKSDTYIWRASYLAALNVSSQFAQDPDQNFDILRFGLAEWRKVNRYLLKEFYALTPYHGITDTTGFTAFCYFDPECEQGIVLAFRQEECEEDILSFELPFAKDVPYVLTDEDTGSAFKTQDGKISLPMPEKRMSRLLWVSLAMSIPT